MTTSNTRSGGITRPWSRILPRRQCIMTLNMLFEGAEGLGGNILHEQLSDDIAGHPGADGPPAPGEIVHNAYMDERTIRLQKPGDVHPATYPADMREADAVLVRLQALPGGPTHGKAVAMRRHLHQPFGGTALQDGDPAIMRQQAGPRVHRTRHRENMVNVSTDRDAILRMHPSLLSWCG